MLLVIDIGNTNIVLGVFAGRELVHSWRVSTRRDQTGHEYAVLFRNLFSLRDVDREAIDAAVICSVVPPLNKAFEEMATEFFGVEPCFIEPEEQRLMKILYRHPSEVGADRIVNAIAARELYGAPAVIVDFGTATTFDVVSREGDYLGGTISPGIGISSEALFSRAARLPRVDIRRPDHAIGRTTVESMQAGIFFGYAGLVDGILARIQEEIGEAVVVATGGFARLLGGEVKGFDHIEENLTMRGLEICYRGLWGPEASSRAPTGR